jgi:3-dehydroquinate synthase
VTSGRSGHGWRFLTIATAATSAAFLASYGLSVALGWDLLERLDLDEANARVAVLGVLALALDALLPVASSLVMVALGSLFPIPVAFGLAFAGREAMSVICFVTGRFGRGLAAMGTTIDERSAASRLLDRRGAYAILLSRPIPVVAESVLVVAGMTGMATRKALAAATLASACEAAAFVVLGHVASGFVTTATLWVVLIALALCSTLVAVRRPA